MMNLKISPQHIININICQIFYSCLLKFFMGVACVAPVNLA